MQRLPWNSFFRAFALSLVGGCAGLESGDPSLQNDPSALNSNGLTLACTGAQFAMPAITPQQCAAAVAANPGVGPGSLCTYNPSETITYIAPDVDASTVHCTASPAGGLTLGWTQVTITCDYMEAGASYTQTLGCFVGVVDSNPLQIACPDVAVDECDTEPLSLPMGCELCYPVASNCQVDPLDPTTYSCADRVVGRLGVPPGQNLATCRGKVVKTGGGAPVLQYKPSFKYIWPPNHQYVPYDIGNCIVRASDGCTGADIDLATNAAIVRIESDEYEESSLFGKNQGDGNTCYDAIIASPTKALLRAERATGLDGRVYRIVFNVTNPSTGEATEGACVVGVPPSSGQDAVEGDCAFCVGDGCGACPGHSPACK
jgi:hypothetical protein